MNLPTIITPACNFPDPNTGPACATGPGGLCPGGSDNHTPGPDAVLVGLVILPDSGFCDIGGTWQFFAIAQYSDGATVDVTLSSDWTSSAPSVATMATTGLALAVSGGIITVTASYNGFAAFASLQVAAVCHNIGVDIVLAMERASSMLIEEDGKTRLEMVTEGASDLIDGIFAATDQVGLISFSGIRYQHVDGVPDNFQGEATVDHGLSSDKVGLNTALSEKYAVRGPCNFPHVLTGPNNRCAIGIGTALQTAYDVITGSGHISGNRRLIILVVDGRDQIGDPVPAVVSAAIQVAGIILMIVGIDIPLDYNATLSALATPGLYISLETAATVPDVLALAKFNIFCQGYNGYTYGNLYYSPTSPYSPPPPPNDGDPGGVAGSLEGLRWEIPCIFTSFGGIFCSCIEPPVKIANLAGDQTKLYNVTLRFRGVIELWQYTGGVANGNFYIGGDPGINPAGFNIYKMTVQKLSGPTDTYFMNHKPLGSIDPNDDVVRVDYTVTIQMYGKSVVALKAAPTNNSQGANRLHLVVPGIPPSPAPFNGQFLQMDVVSVVQL